MFTELKIPIRKMFLVVLVLTIGLVTIPLPSARAAGLDQQPIPPQADNHRLESIWAREVTIFHHAEGRLAKADEFIRIVQAAINRAKAKGWDTDALQTVLDTFKNAVQDARPILNSARGIVASHKGFDDNGEVTDRAKAIESIKELSWHLKAVRDTMDGTGKALRDAIKDFREEHLPPPTPTVNP